MTTTTTKQYCKIWFTNGEERTAQLIVDTERYPRFSTTLAAFSRLFPAGEARLMKHFYMGEAQPTWEQAFTSYRLDNDERSR